MVQRQSGDESDNGFSSVIHSHASVAVLTEIQSITLFQDMHLVKETQIKNLIFKHCVFRVILPKGVGFLVGKGHP